MKRNDDWIFLNCDGSKQTATLATDCNSPGDGKFHNGKEYVVKCIVSGRTTSENNLIIAVEIGRHGTPE